MPTGISPDSPASVLVSWLLDMKEWDRDPYSPLTFLACPVLFAGKDWKGKGLSPQSPLVMRLQPPPRERCGAGGCRNFLEGLLRAASDSLSVWTFQPLLRPFGPGPAGASDGSNSSSSSSSSAAAANLSSTSQRLRQQQQQRSALRQSQQQRRQRQWQQR